MIAGPWKDHGEFDDWWRINVRAFNLLAVRDPREWERVAQAIDAFYREFPR